MTIRISKCDDLKVRITLGNLFEPLVACTARAKRIQIAAILHHDGLLVFLTTSTFAEKTDLANRR